MSREKIKIPDQPFHKILTDSAGQCPEKTALVFAPTGKEMSYKQLEEQSSCFAHALQKLGVEKSDRIAIVLPNSFETVISFFGGLKAGVIAVPLNPQYTPTELEGILGDSGIKTIITSKKLTSKFTQLKEGVKPQKIITAKEVSELVSRHSPKYNPVGIKPKDLGVLQYTAGTTGKPKGVMITHRNMIAIIAQMQEAFSYQPAKAEHLLVAPPFHVAGLVDCIGIMIYVAGTTVLMPKFSPLPTLEAISEYKPTWLFGVPAIYQALLETIKKTGKKWELESLRFRASGTAKCSSTVLQEFQKLGAPVIEGYGLTETTGVCFVNPIGKGKPGSVGLPFAKTKVKIVDPDSDKELATTEEGEILVKGPHVAAGYWKSPKKTKKAFTEGWLRTGDIGYLDEDEYLYIVDRLKDLINVRGEKVSSIEVEETLETHPVIKEAAVVGIPNSYWGEKVVAYVNLEEPANTSSFQKHCEDRLVDYKVPKEIITTDSFPRSSTGKVLKRELRK